VLLLHDPVLVRLSGPDPGRAHPVVVQQVPITPRQGPPRRPLQLVGRRRQIVRPGYLRASAQLPKRSLQPHRERLEGLGKRQAGPRPTAVAQHQLEQQMVKWLIADRDPQLLAVREVEGGFASRRMLLGEHHIPIRPVERPPVPHPSLQRPALALPESARVFLVQLGQQRPGLQLPLLVPLQQRHQLGTPHAGEGIRPRSPVPQLLRGRR
jgi:hypothetical protein